MSLARVTVFGNGKGSRSLRREIRAEAVIIGAVQENEAQSRQRPLGTTLLVIFFAFGFCAAGVTFVLLLFPGTELDIVWRLNPHAREGFAKIGAWAALLMLVVSAACALAAIGLWRRTCWGFWMAVAILGINLAGDTANALIVHDYRTLVGLPIGGYLLGYLFKQRRVQCPVQRRHE